MLACFRPNASEELSELPNVYRLQNALLRDHLGNHLTAGSLWKENPALMLVIRRPGCSENKSQRSDSPSSAILTTSWQQKRYSEFGINSDVQV